MPSSSATCTTSGARGRHGSRAGATRSRCARARRCAAAGARCPWPRRLEHEGQIEGRLVARVHRCWAPPPAWHTGCRCRHVALEVLVDHGEAERQVDLLGPRLDERLALGIDRDEVLPGDHPAGRTAALLELQLVIALDRIEGVGGRQSLERAADADLAGDAEAVHSSVSSVTSRSAAVSPARSHRP